MDAVVIGGGVNALTSASYLAKAGREVTIVCPEEKIGGLCARNEFLPGYQSPGILYDTSMFRSWIADDLGLDLDYVPHATVAYGRDQQLVLSENVDDTAQAIAKVSERDAGNYRGLQAFYKKIGEPIGRYLNNIPPDLVDPAGSDLWSLFKRGFGLRKLGKRDMLEVLRLAPMPVYDWLDEWFENDGLKAAMALPAVTESYSGPWSPGTNANLLIHEVTRGRPVAGGGLAVVEALKKAALSFGVYFEDAETVAVEPGKGVRLRDGGFMEAKTIFAAVGPKKLFLKMMEPRRLGSKFEQRLMNFRTRGLTSQLLLAVDSSEFQVPGSRSEESSEFRVQSSDPNKSSDANKTNLELGTWNLELFGAGAPRALIASTLDEIERAFDPVKYGELPERPCLEVYFPSREHADLAPEGKAVISVLIHYTPYDLKGGWTEEAKEMLSESVIGILEEKMPGIAASVVGRKLLTPPDIEARYDLAGGQIYEGEHALDQLLVRPTPECSQYKTPFEGLFLCSGGSFPGGGLTGAPGALAVRKVLE